MTAAVKRTAGLSVSQEDYLKALVEIELEGEPLIAATLARWLEVSAPAVTMALARLRRDGLIAGDVDGKLRLSDEGRRIADRIRYRHYLIERMLTEIFGMEWYKVHEEAERLEHAVSEDFESRLLAVLGPEPDCPHGSHPTRESVATRRDLGWRKLPEMPSGQSLRVVSVSERSRALLEYFDQLGLRPGSSLSIVHSNEDQTLTLEVDARSVTIGLHGANQIWVEPAASAVKSTSKSR